jgi:hypothetical protein
MMTSTSQHRARWAAGVRLVGVLIALGSGGLLVPGRTAPAPAIVEAAPPSWLRFEPNQGQTDEAVRFLARGPDYGLHLSRTSATLALGRPGQRPAVVTMRLAGAAPVEPAGDGLQRGKSSYLLGGDRSRWRTGVPGYAGVRYREVRPGVDLVYHGSGQGRLEYDLVLAPGADPRELRMTFGGVERTTVDPDGTAVLRLAGGSALRKAPPRAYQEGAGGERVAVVASYRVGSDGSLGFDVGAFDRARPLIIDPELLFSTYFGGSNSDGATALARDSSGAIYLAGYTLSANFPTVTPVQGGNAGSYDVYVTKLFEGNTIAYSTYLGGNGEDRATGLAVDGAGNVYVTGFTYSSNFPTSVPLQGASAGAPDAFVAKLGGTGALVYSTYLGGAGADASYGVAVDSGGAAYVTGYTASTDFPTAAPIQAALSGSSDAFVAKLNDAGSALVYSTYLGGTGDEVSNGIAVDSTGRAHLVGWTASSNFPTALPVQASRAGASDVFVARLSPAGSALSFSTYLGGAGTDVGLAIAVDPSFGVYVAGYTNSADFPMLSALQGEFRGTFDGFVSKLTAPGTALAYSTYLGGSFHDRANAIALADGQATVVGYTESLNFPVSSPSQATHGGGLGDAFVTTVSTTGSALVTSSYLGGGAEDNAHAVTVGNGHTFVAGTTSSSNFPVVKPIQGTNRGGPWDAFLAHFGLAPAPVPASSSLTSAALAGLLLGLFLALAPRRPGRQARG